MPTSREQVKSPVSTLADLQSALQDGWVIDPPVYRKCLSDRKGDRWSYDFIMWRNNRVHVITVPDEPEVCEFVLSQGLDIDGH